MLDWDSIHLLVSGPHVLINDDFRDDVLSPNQEQISHPMLCEK